MPDARQRARLCSPGLIRKDDQKLAHPVSQRDGAGGGEGGPPPPLLSCISPSLEKYLRRGTGRYRAVRTCEYVCTCSRASNGRRSREDFTLPPPPPPRSVVQIRTDPPRLSPGESGCDGGPPWP